jgi:hypothetical protein
MGTKSKIYTEFSTNIMILFANKNPQKLKTP